MTNCTDMQLTIQLFVDGELACAEVEEMLRHVATCPDCAQCLEEAKNLSQKVRAAKAPFPAPEMLRQRLQERIASREQKVAPKLKLVATISTWRRWPLAAIAAMLLLTITSVLFFRMGRREDQAELMMHTAVMAHRELQQNQIPLDILSNSPQEVSEWFGKRVSFPFHMADTGIASDDRAKYKLVGGRLMSVRGEHVALLSFRLSNELVSLLIGSGEFAIDEGGTAIESNGVILHSRDRDALHIVSWKNRGLSYVLVFRTAPSNKGKCERCHEAAHMSNSNVSRMHEASRLQEYLSSGEVKAVGAGQ